MQLKSNDQPIVTLEYASPVHNRHGLSVGTGIGLGTTELGLALLNSLLTSCMCGYMSMVSAPGNVLAFTLASVGFLAGRGGVISRIVTAVSFIGVSLLAFQNVHNVLWSGHDPLLR